MRSWILPCNVKRYDVIEHFKKNEFIVWRYHHGIIDNDIAYIYLAAPHQDVRYRCRVINKRVDESIINNNPYAKRDNVTRYILLKLEKEYPSGKIIYKDLKQCGLGQVLNICVAGEKVTDFIHSIESQMS